MTRGTDWVWVRLTAKGEELAGAGALTIAGGRYHFSFIASEAQKVTRAFDWEQVLKNERRGGEPLFELAEPVSSFEFQVSEKDSQNQERGE